MCLVHLRVSEEGEGYHRPGQDLASGPPGGGESQLTKDKDVGLLLGTGRSLGKLGCSKASVPPSPSGVLESFFLLWPVPIHGHPLFRTALALKVNLSAHGHQGSSPNHTHHQLHPFFQSRAGLQVQPVPRRAAWTLSLTRPWLPREGGHCVTSWKSGGDLPRGADQAPVSLAMQSVGSGRELALQRGHARAWWWGQGW